MPEVDTSASPPPPAGANTEHTDQPLPTKRRVRPGGKNVGAGGGHGTAAWAWTPQREGAALDLAIGELSIDKIAEKHHVSSASVARWKTAPEMQARIGELHASFRAHVATEGIAIVSARVERRNDYWARLKSIVEARAVDAKETMPDVPGAETGLIIRKRKGVGKKIIEEFETDNGLLQELDRLETATARDLGQHVDRREYSGPNGGPLRISAEVTIGYQNGALRDIADEFFQLMEAGSIPEDVATALAAVRAAALSKNLDEGADRAKAGA